MFTASTLVAMRKDATTPIPELLDPRRHTTKAIVLRAHRAHPHATPEVLAYITHVRVGLVRWALGVDEDDEPAAAGNVIGGARKRGIRTSETYALGSRPVLWEAASSEREKKRKAAAEKHHAWLIKRGIKPVSAQEDTPSTRPRASNWRDNDHRA